MIAFQDYCNRIEQHIVRSYGIGVVTRDVPDPLTGDLDGAEIQIDYAVTPEQRLFLLAHLFGHTVQWNVNPLAFELGRPRNPPVDEASMPALINYERDAASYALSMLHEVGITDIDQWLSDYTACDMAYLSHYYRTGEKKGFLTFWRDHTPRVEARPIPHFTPTRRSRRSDGVVI
jgi:hypothetical protein